MQFNSYSYLLLLPVVVAIFWSLPADWRRGYVLLVSVAFYAAWNPLYTAIPLTLCAATYFFARLIVLKPEKARAAMWGGITFVLGFLIFFKYRQFLWDNFAGLLPAGHSNPAAALAGIALPLGISFYSFEAVSYLIDTRQKRVREVNFRDLSVFVMFWPHLIAGPIVRVRELVPQLAFKEKFSAELIFGGIDRIVWGLVQKNLLANNLGAWVDDGFAARAAAANTSIDNWFLAMAFGMQIYFDFAAYSNMAIGAAQLIGIKLPENFRFPYHSQTPPEFWSRWHMTLSRWIRDYVFFPLNARFRDSKAVLYGSLIGTMALVGLWHGAGWGFIAWGVLHGTYMVAYRAYEELAQTRYPSVARSWLARAAWRMLTLAAVTAAWIPFRATTLNQARSMLASMLWRPAFGISYSVNFYLVTILIALVCLAEPYLAQVMKALDNAVSDRRLPDVVRLAAWRPLVYACGLLLFMIFDDLDTKFIYFQF